MTPRVLLLYPPLQFVPGCVPKPDGSLGLAYLAGALRDAGIDVSILDAAVGRDGSAFDQREALPSGLVRVGMSDAEIVQAASGYTAVGVASTFTAQHRMALRAVKALRAAYPDKRLLVGGTSARAFAYTFLTAGADAVFLSEADLSIVAAVTGNLCGVPGTIMRGAYTPPVVANDLGALPMPAWDMLPNEAYWRIGRPHGGAFGAPIKYAAMMTSRGCPFSCRFCHVAAETDGSTAGPISALRVKSMARVERELDAIQALGVDRVYIEDDSLLARKKRAIALFGSVKRRGLELADVNGVNVAHLFTRQGGVLVPDRELIDAMVAAGFRDVSLPFESASLRILATYASNKWNPDRHDAAALVRACVAAGLPVSGNYMIGFPDETEGEITSTLGMTRRHMDAGMAEANVFLVIPLPGTPLFDYARTHGYLPDDWDPDSMVWFQPSMINTTVPPKRLIEIRESAWRSLNTREYVAARVAAGASA